MERNKKLAVPIAVSATVVFFMLFFFGGFAFPQIGVLDLFKTSFGATQSLLSGSGTGGSDSSATGQPGALTSINEFVTIVDFEEGTGIQAKSGDMVSVGYVGTHTNTPDGQTVEFDKNTDKSAPFSFILGAGQVIEGFDLGIIGMREGGQRLIIIQPESGYGNQQVGNIPPNTTLHFVVTLYEVK